jgi:uncharacterized protein (DUF1778 family)
MTKIEAAVSQHILVAGGDPAVETAANMLLSALEPAIRQMAMELAEQAAAEVASQISGYEIDVVLSEGEPTLRVRSVEEEISLGDAMDARITLRLPPHLKEIIEQAADERGESLNTWVVKTISSRSGSQRRRRGRRVEGTIET